MFASPAPPSPSCSPVSSPTIATRSVESPVRPARRAAKRPRHAAAAHRSPAADVTSLVKVSKTRPPAARTPLTVMRTGRRRRRVAGTGTGAGAAAGGGGGSGTAALMGRRGAGAPPVARQLVMDFAADGAGAGVGAGGEAAAAPQDADAVGAMEAAARRLRAEAADGFAARWDFDVRHGRPVEAPAVWRWSPVEA
ncbi:hypothetical protein BU14_2771s0001 [Porphyra umbilicalis]|uniref:Cyclin-dependent kinase inhibitor domain-containing protein n=1 Tax=Porphyra umbilicalis TaxID=2786 RepID=A0A1X6NIM5_PORUM|nr:hypothetical protein BU14_2771s0001 [Porphyra umbilicalis]|eukprot:OSX68455.1 hypothetical protein BU14_2771s0001 [Porphyra umbilicalis]